MILGESPHRDKPMWSQAIRHMVILLCRLTAPRGRMTTILLALADKGITNNRLLYLR
jgi:hypothetical protein